MGNHVPRLNKSVTNPKTVTNPEQSFGVPGTLLMCQDLFLRMCSLQDEKLVLYIDGTQENNKRKRKITEKTSSKYYLREELKGHFFIYCKYCYLGTNIFTQRSLV